MDMVNLLPPPPQAGSPFREPLIKFLTRHPSQTVELFMMEATLNDPQWSRMFMVRQIPSCLRASGTLSHYRVLTVSRNPCVKTIAKYKCRFGC